MLSIGFYAYVVTQGTAVYFNFKHLTTVDLIKKKYVVELFLANIPKCTNDHNVCQFMPVYFTGHNSTIFYKS